jgi:CubicO group peptidase (beta-lactamase class C family)
VAVTVACLGIDRGEPVLISAADVAALESARVAAGIPGMTMAVLDDGEVAWSRGFGTRAANDRRPVDEHTVFEAASLSKPVVAYLALRLADAGRFDLDRPLLQYVPVPDLEDPRAASITPRMILSHTTGLQNELIGNDRLALAFEPGERFRYSGEGFLLLQRALEAIGGQRLDVLTPDLVLTPLGMTRSGFVWHEDFALNAAVWHGESLARLTPSRPRVARASSSFDTTAHDYARFVRALIHREGVSREGFDEMLTARVRAGDGVDWGLGWALEASPAGRAAWHWGDNSNSGFTSFAWADLDRRRAVIYFADSTTGLSMVRPVLGLVTDGEHPVPAFMGH